MSTSINLVDRGYRYLPGVFQYSRGVAAEPGFAIHRVELEGRPNIQQGFDLIAQHLTAIGRPLQAFCHCELRSPAPFSEDGFRNFNLQYVETLKAWGIMLGMENPVARSNLCPRQSPPTEPCFYAFSYTVEQRMHLSPSFVISGCGEAPEGKTNYHDYIVRCGDVSESALAEKADFVLNEQARRLAGLGFEWNDVTCTNVYTVHPLFASLTSEIQRRGAARRGLTWHDCRPPVVDIEFEMDCRRVMLSQIK